MGAELSRRAFLVSAAAAAAVGSTSLADAASSPATVASSTAPSTQPRKLNIGVVGVGNRGFGNLTEAARSPNANIVALCDVDAVTLVNAARMHLKAGVYTDYRDLLKHKDLDAVVVATADHTHAVITAAALKAGKHVYCEKPLCHTISELRTIVELAKQTNRVTQLGVQNHALPNIKKAVEIVRSGAIGQVKDVYVWHNRQRRDYSTALAPVPAALNYDLWIGPQAMRPFRLGYHPYSWRNWWAFGDAELGDQACHFLDIVFQALDLTVPTHIEASGSEKPDEEMVCNHIVATYQFPARGDKPAVTLHWYDYPNRPAQVEDWKVGKDLESEAVMFVGSEGMLCTDYKHQQLLPEEKFAGFKGPELVKSPEHHQDWIDAVLKNDPSSSAAPFHYGARLTETAILGTLAYRVGLPLEWDPEAMKFAGMPEAERMLGYEYREGWKV